MFLTMTLSVTFSLLPFASALMVMGPIGTDGMLSNFYGPMLRRSYATLQAERTKALAHVPAHAGTTDTGSAAGATSAGATSTATPQEAIDLDDTEATELEGGL